MIRKKFVVLCAILLSVTATYVFSYPDSIQTTNSVSSAVEKVYSTPNGRYLFSMSGTTTTMAVFDNLLFKEVASYEIGYIPYEMTVSSDGLHAYLVTSLTDNIIDLNITDPENIVEEQRFSLGTSGVTFRHIAKASVSGKTYLYATDASNNRVYVYNATDDVLATGGTNPVSLSFTPSDIEVSPDGLTFAVISSDGEMQVYSASAFGSVAGPLDVGAYSTTDNFIKISLASVPSYGEVAFLLNSNTTGEIFLISMGSKLVGSIAVLDADPTGGGANDPITVGSTPYDIKLATVSNPDSGDSSGLYIYCSVSGDSTVKVIDTKDVTTVKLESLATISSAGIINTDGIAAGTSADGYIYFGVQDAQTIKVVSENPIVTVVSPTDDVDLESGTVDIKFKSNISGSYKVTRYTGGSQGTVSDTVGTTLKSGSLTADQEITATISTNSLIEGDNFIAIFVDDGSFTGREGVKINYNTVPSTPGGFKVEFGNQKIIISFERNSESDMDHYNLYFGTSEGSLTGADGITSPISVAHPTSGTMVSYTIEPLTNGVEIFAQVSAVDSVGNESERTGILSSTPEETVGPIELSGEDGGCGMTRTGTGGGYIILLALLPFIFLLIKRRKKTVISVLMAVLFSFSAVAQEAEEKKADDPVKDEKGGQIMPDPLAKDENVEPIRIDAPIKDESKAPEMTLTSPISEPKIKLNDVMSGAFKVSWFVPKSAVLKSFYGKTGNEMYGVKSTFFVWLFEAGINVDFLRENSRMIGTVSGDPSGEKTSLTMLPISFPIYFNLRFADNQIFVPYAKFGYSLLYFRISEPSNTVSGVRHNFLSGGGLKFDFESISDEGMGTRDLGLNHMFLFFEALYSHDFKSGAGISFSGFSWGFGLGVDY